jgi:hypothetical protein
MSQPTAPSVEPAGGVARKRPLVVSAAVVLLGVLGIGFCVLSLADYALFGLMGFSGGPPAMDFYSAATPILFGVAFFVLGVFVAKGRQGARVTTWVVSALLALCTGCSGLVAVGMDRLRHNVQSNPVRELVALAQIDLVLMARVFVFLLVSIVIIVLLALPAANAFFRRQPTVSSGSTD